MLPGTAGAGSCAYEALCVPHAGSHPQQPCPAGAAGAWWWLEVVTGASGCQDAAGRPPLLGTALRESLGAQTVPAAPLQQGPALTRGAERCPGAAVCLGGFGNWGLVQLQQGFKLFARHSVQKADQVPLHCTELAPDEDDFCLILCRTRL